MIYFLFGSDTDTSRVKLKNLTEYLRAKKPNATYVRFDAESFVSEELSHLIGGQGLFEQKLIVVFDNVLSNEDSKTVIVKRLKDISASKNIFLIREAEVDGVTRKKIEKYAEKIQEHILPKSKVVTEKPFSIFGLSDELGERNKKRLWVLYQKGRFHGVSAEEAHGILFWGVKSIHLAQGAQNAKEAQLNPFVFKKAARFARNYSSAELNNLSASLITLYHDARRGTCPLDIALERFILSM